MNSKPSEMPHSHAVQVESVSIRGLAGILLGAGFRAPFRHGVRCGAQAAELRQQPPGEFKLHALQQY
ncbi:hypothetical protein [Polaromonas sp. LjRoot131]|uniref:hypothetical protein n=1 Tax=Polaromonas sp. LjRoot131 TaxID=3342262 RepID=UPI003ECD22CB